MSDDRSTDRGASEVEPAHPQARPVERHADSDPYPNPGIEPHLTRPTDVDDKADRRVERQVSTLFAVSALLTLGFCVAYFAIDKYSAWAGTNALNLVLGCTLGGALLLIGIGAIQWSKMLMDDHEVVELRHSSGSSAEDQVEALASFEQGAAESGFGRRRMLRGSLLASLGVLGLPAVILLGDLGPLPGNRPRETVWAKGVRVVTDPEGEPLRLSDIQLGQLVNAQPSVLFETDEEGEPLYEGTERLNAKAKASVIVVRIDPADLVNPDSEAKSVEGVLCFSKICTHLGCPISLYEQQLRRVLCPCHQSTFDLSDGAKVVFGPAARSLPQLDLGIDEQGYLVALGDFDAIVGPSFPEMTQD